MNSNNELEQFLDDYYNIILERNDEDRVVITPAYVDFTGKAAGKQSLPH